MTKDQGSNWLFDEFAHAGDEHLDPTYVRTYDRKAGTDPTADVALLRDLGLDTRATLVDLGAGTGAFALAAARFSGSVVAVDVSSAMLANLRAKLERLGSTNVTCVRAGFLTYQHAPETADFVYSRNALHHLPDFWKALALERIAAMLRSGGTLLLRDLVFSFAPGDAASTIEAWLAAAPPTSDHGWTRAELETHLRDEYSTYSWLLESMLERSGFEITSVSHSPSKVFGAYTAVKR
ncbi:MAG: methyltransferase domain-containing protein [Chloroflexi bacterium]|nr:MAG: methyltransferase domain-containing protein [Chloroflexota bacterium]